MKFTVSSLELFSTLQQVSKVITPSHTMPILDHFLFELDEDKLVVTASDLETSQITAMSVSTIEQVGAVCMQSRLIIDFLKELPDQPIVVEVNPINSEMIITWDSGTSSLPGLPAEGYPNISERMEEETIKFMLPSNELHDGLNNTLFAAADKNIRPILNGVCIDIRTEKLVFVATDAHKLVKMTFHKSLGLDSPMMIVIPKRAANIIRTFAVKESGEVNIEIDCKNIYFTFSETTIICRLIEGKFPNYDMVIPTNNSNKLICDRVTFLNSIRRVGVCANKVNNMIMLHLTANSVMLEAKNPEFQLQANDTIHCSYEGEEMIIGFKAPLLIDILSTISTDEIVLELESPTKAGLILPVVNEESTNELISLIMPIMP